MLLGVKMGYKGMHLDVEGAGGALGGQGVQEEDHLFNLMLEYVKDGPPGSPGSGRCLYNESLSNYFLQRGSLRALILMVSKGKFYKRRNIRTLFGFGSVHFYATISPRHSLMNLTMIS